MAFPSFGLKGMKELDMKLKGKGKGKGKKMPNPGQIPGFENLSEADLAQAKNFWSMLDEMAENDPEEYRAFVEKQAQTADAAEGGTHTQNQAEADRDRGYFVPTAGFCVKTHVLKAGVRVHLSGGGHEEERWIVDNTKVFLNFCSHPGVQLPQRSDGTPIDPDDASEAARQVPLLIGERRRVADSSKRTAAAVDVVFNPWVLERAGKDWGFQSQMIELALSWLEKDVNSAGEGSDVRLSRAYKTLKNNKYKFGGGKGGSPVRFSLDFADEQVQGGKESESGSGNGNGNGSGKKKKGKDKKGAQAQRKGKGLIDSPKDLLAQLGQSNDASNNDSGGIGESQINIHIGPQPKGAAAKSKQGAKPLIEEIGPPSKPLIEEVSPSSPSAATAEEKATVDSKGAGSKKGKKKKTTKKGGKAVKKGFLNKAKGGELYGEEGSTEYGGWKNPLEKFCKVVDTRNMGEDEMKKCMEEYADTGSVGTADAQAKVKKAKQQAKANTKAAPKQKTQAKTTAGSKKSSIKKGFLNNMKGNLYKEDDAAFDALMADADPELGRSNVTKESSNNDEMTKYLEAMAQTMGSGAAGHGSGADIDPEAWKKFAGDLMPELASDETAQQLKQAQELLARPKVTVDETETEKAEANKPAKVKKTRARATPQHTVSTKGDAITVKIALPLLTSMGGVELDVSSLGLKLKHDQYLLRCKFPKAIDEDSVKAKFSKKKQSLTIKCTAKA